MKYILVRDDDINYFTASEDIFRAYGFLLEKKIPINFSIIPSINTSGRPSRDLFGENAFEPFLPRAAQGDDKEYPITLNKELITALNSLTNTEFLLHGFNHKGIDEKFEFEIDGTETIEEKLRRAIDIFRSAFGTAPRTFVAPEDKYTKNAIKAIMDKFDVFSTGWVDKKRIPASFLFNYYWMKFTNGNILKHNKFLMVEHPGCLFSKFKTGLYQQRLDPYLKRHEATIIVVHHWEFFDNGTLIKELHNAFKERVLSLHKEKGFKFIKFSELYDMKMTNFKLTQ